MHSYLRAIGFANITKESEVEKLLEDVYKKFDHRDCLLYTSDAADDNESV